MTIPKYPHYDASTGKFPCATSKQTGDKTLFAFVGNPYTGYKIQNLALGEEKAVGGTITNNGHVSPVAFESAPYFVLEDNSGHLVLRNTANSLGYLNDIQGTLGYWVNASAATDGGSTLTFTMEKDTATGIAKTEGEKQETEIYDLSGRRLSVPVKGINIVDGKKVVY